MNPNFVRKRIDAKKGPYEISASKIYRPSGMASAIASKSKKWDKFTRGES